MWTAPVTIFEGEDEAALIARFVELSARYPKEPIFAITQYVFKNLRDPDTRANQAALVWANDLEIRERIRKAQDNGGSEPEVITEEERYIRKCEAEANNLDNPATVRYKWFELASKMRGLVKEPADSGGGDNKRPQLPTFIIAQYSDQDAA